MLRGEGFSKPSLLALTAHRLFDPGLPIHGRFPSLALRLYSFAWDVQGSITHFHVQRENRLVTSLAFETLPFRAECAGFGNSLPRHRERRSIASISLDM